MGASMALLMSEGLRVGILDLTDGEPTPRGSPAVRAQETEAASAVLGVAWRRCLGLPNRSLEHTLETRRAVAVVLRCERPRVLFAPYGEDAHPDHVATTAIVEAARFWAKLTRSDMPGEPHLAERVYYYYHGVHLRVAERPSFVLDVSPHLEAKLRAVACYRSQFPPSGTAPPPLLDELRSRARYWGWAIGRMHGEPFACRETVGLPGLTPLL